MRSFFLFSLLLLLSACTRVGETPTATTGQTPAMQPTPLAEVIATATVPLPPTQSVAPTGSAPSSPTEPGPTSTSPALTATVPAPVLAGHTPEGAYYLGDPGAPVTVIDYSDFM